MIKKIVFCTLRDNLGATGGPGGVLYMQKIILGNSIEGLPCEYWFNPISSKVTKLTKILNPLIIGVKALFTTNAFFIVHDVKAGCIMSLLKKKYSIIHHQQGPCQEERINLGAKRGVISTSLLNWEERCSFTGAMSVHFPSSGAADMYFDSKYATCKKYEVKIGKPLYNVIPKTDVNNDCPVKKAPNALTFFSLGTLTKAKGQDNTIKFMETFATIYSKPIQYIIVGKGPLKDGILTDLNKIKKNHANFTFTYIESLPHDKVMAIHKMADVYIMLHRISIFDFATLEAMSQNTAIVLSPIGGNIDFNKENNVLYVGDKYVQSAKELSSMDVEQMKESNYKVFSNYFSEKAFREQYEVLIQGVLK